MLAKEASNVAYSHAFSCFFLSFFANHRTAPFRAPLNGLQGRNLLLHRGIGVIAICPTVHIMLLPSLLLHFSLYLIFIRLFSICLTSLLAAVPSPLPTQQLCGGRWGVSQLAAVSAQAVHSCLCTTEQAKSVCLPWELLFTACAEFMSLVTAVLFSTDVPSRSGNLLLF